MVDVVALPKGVVRRRPSAVVELSRYAVPVGMALVLVVSGSLLAERLQFLRGWSDTYSADGRFLVDGCAESGGLGADQWVCRGTLDTLSIPVNSLASGATPSLITSAGAHVSQRPVSGATVPVFFDPTRPATVHPTGDRLAEVARLYLSLLPRLLLTVGAALWLFGWFVANPNFAPRSRRLRGLAQQEAWTSRGAAWLTAGVLTMAANYVVVHWVIGSLGTA